MKKKTIKINNAGMSFLINAAFLILVILFCDMKYEVSDDFVMDTVLSGAYGTDYNEYMLFSNILLGCFLKALYRLIPVISWYFVYHILICFLSLWAVSYIIFEKNNRYVAVLLSLIFTSFFSDDLYILPQFTKTAAVASVAGGMLFLHGISYDYKMLKKVILALAGGGLALIGTMTRFSCFYISIAFLGLGFLEVVWIKRKQLKNIMRIFVSCCMLVVVAYSLRYINSYIWSQNSEYQAYLDYNHIRASVTDKSSYGYESVQPELEELGISFNDYAMVETWNFLDQDCFPDERLEEISKIKSNYSNIVNHSILSILKQFVHRGYQKYLTVIGIGVIFLLLVILEPKKAMWAVCKLFTTVLILLYFFYRGRVVYRVEYGILVGLAICLCISFEKQCINPEIKKAFIYWMCIVCLCKLPLYIPDTSYQTMTDEEYSQYIYDVFYESWNYDIRKYRCNVTERKPYGNLTDYIEQDREHFYLLDFSSTIQLIYYNYKPWIRLPIGYYNNYSYIGGVTTRYPDNLSLWEKQGIDIQNPYKSIVNDNIYLVDKDFAGIKFEYIKEKYYPDAKAELIDVKDGFNIWKFTK